MEIKIGDMVTVREWDDMKKDFGLDSNGNIPTPGGSFSTGMKELCGKPAIVEAIIREGRYKLRPMHIEDIFYDWGWVFTEAMLKH